MTLIHRLRFDYPGQPTADTGGVVRRFYTQLLAAIIDSPRFTAGLIFYIVKQSTFYNTNETDTMGNGET